MDLTLLARTIVDAPACPSYTPGSTLATEILCYSEEAARFGWCTGVFVSVPIVSIDNGEVAAESALTPSQTRTRAHGFRIAQRGIAPSSRSAAPGTWSIAQLRRMIR